MWRGSARQGPHAALAALLLAAALGGALHASGPSAPAVSRWVVATGGGASGGGRFALVATAGQAEAGATLSGGSFAVRPGFWGAGGAGDERLFLPLLRR